MGNLAGLRDLGGSGPRTRRVFKGIKDYYFLGFRGISRYIGDIELSIEVVTRKLCY